MKVAYLKAESFPARVGLTSKDIPQNNRHYRECALLVRAPGEMKIKAMAVLLQKGKVVLIIEL